MAQNLTTLFGAAGAARFVQLVNDRVRTPCWRLRVYGPQGKTLIGDITPYLKSFSPQFTDETKSDGASFVLSNAGGQFDRYGSGPMSQWLLENNVLVMEKGLVDPLTDNKFLVPAFWGIIGQAAPTYQPKGDAIITVSCFDAFKLAVKQKISTFAYENYEVNVVAADLLKTFAKIGADRLDLAPVSRVYDYLVFPDVPLVDALKLIYEPLQFGVRADEAGKVATRARLGSGLSVMANLSGFPDQLTAPPANAVAYVVPDELSVETIDARWQDFEGVPNQIRVKGRAQATQQKLGPNQILTRETGGTVEAKENRLPKYEFSDGASSGQNALIAQNVIVEFKASTDHNLDTNPQVKYLSRMPWKGVWSANTNYKRGEAVSHTGTSYAAGADVTGYEPGASGSEAFWDALPFNGPYEQFVSIYNSDPKECGFVSLETVTAQYVVMKIEGRQFSVGNAPARRHGGMDYSVTIHGNPSLSFEKVLTAYADYKPQNVTGEVFADLFGDHRTFQADHQPFAMSRAVEVFKDGQSLGKITADQTDLSGESKFSVDYERGRVVLVGATFQDFSRDDSGFHPLSTGGSAQSIGDAIDLTLLDVPAPVALYQSRRDGNSKYTLTGLPVGHSFEIRLHFADPTYGKEGERVFSVFAQNVNAAEGVDIAKMVGGAKRAFQQTLTGIAPDPDGKIVLHVTQNDPVSGNQLESSVGPSAIISGIEVLYPQGQGAAPYAINCGGPELTPTPPVISANYSFSPVQEAYEIQNEETNNPYIYTQSDLQQMADFKVNRAAWRRHPHTIRLASVPHLQPGDLIKYYNPLLGVDFWGYVNQISRNMASGGGDSDTLDLFLIYKQARA